MEAEAEGDVPSHLCWGPIQRVWSFLACMEQYPRHCQLPTKAALYIVQSSSFFFRLVPIIPGSNKRLTKSIDRIMSITYRSATSDIAHKDTVPCLPNK